MGKKARLKKEKKYLSKQEEHPGIPGPASIKYFLKKIAFPAALILIFMLGVSLRIYNLTNVHSRSPDEGVYTYQANTVLQYGPVEGVKKLVDRYNADEKQWIYPPPTRVAYIWPLALLMKMTNRVDTGLGAYMSCFFSIISLLILIALGLRFFNRWITLYALLFMSVSPLSLAIARRTWQDAMLGCVGLLLIYLCCEITRAPRRLIRYILVIAAGSCAMFIKESGAVIYALCMIWLSWILFLREKSALKGLILIAGGLIGVALGVACLSYAAGGISNVLEVMRHVKEAMPSNTYALEYQTGPWYHFLQGFWIVSPVNTVLYLIGIIGAFLSADNNRNAVLGTIFFMMAFMAIAIAAPYCQNMRYVSALFAPFYLIGGLGLARIISYIRAKADRFSSSLIVACAIGIVIAGAANDYRNFIKIIIKPALNDTSIRLLREYSR